MTKFTGSKCDSDGSGMDVRPIQSNQHTTLPACSSAAAGSPEASGSSPILPARDILRLPPTRGASPAPQSPNYGFRRSPSSEAVRLSISPPRGLPGTASFGAQPASPQWRLERIASSISLPRSPEDSHVPSPGSPLVLKKDPITNQPRKASMSACSASYAKNATADPSLYSHSLPHTPVSSRHVKAMDAAYTGESKAHGTKLGLDERGLRKVLMRCRPTSVRSMPRPGSDGTISPTTVHPTTPYKHKSG